MRRFRFGASVLYMASLLPIYFQWSREQSERQIDKMQSAVFNSPGAEATITPLILIGGVTILCSHFIIARKGLDLSNEEAVAGMVVGGGLGLVLYRWYAQKSRR
ncbi:MAG: hypothetical protein R3C14_54440 [Caldilineaceae bacterium]